MLTKAQIEEHEIRMQRLRMQRKLMQEEAEIRRERNLYQNAWRHAHKDRVREYNQNYWRKKVEERQNKNAN